MPFQLLSREVFIPSDGQACIWATSFYTQPTGYALQSIHSLLTRSDTNDVAYFRDSPDNGKSWSEPRRVETKEVVPGATLRRFFYPGYVDPLTGRLIFIHMLGVLPNDDPKKDGWKGWQVHYGVSDDGGATRYVDEMIIQDGYTPDHPLPEHWIGKNATQVAANTCSPITLDDGTIVAPCQMTVLDEDGNYYNPGGGYSYTEPMVLRGTWRPDGTISWEAGSRVQSDPAVSTRGLIEPVLAQLSDGRLLMVLRGSNDVKPDLPGYKWFTTSTDGGRTWSKAAPWTYTDGGNFFSPSSCSQLLRHSSGKLFWLGNLVPENPLGNHPRYPIVIGEVDDETGFLCRDTVFPIDTRGPEDHPGLQLSNFYAREDRATGNIILHCTRVFAAGPHPDGTLNWVADALIYRISIQ